ncbi:MAG: hypothetical protein AB9866_04010 [Syntrophobacteraceae bacterium]
MKRVARHNWLLHLVIMACLIPCGDIPSHAADAGALFTRGPDMQIARDLFSIATLPDGKVAVLNGQTYGAGILSTGEIWDPATGQFTLCNTNYGHYFPGFARLADGNYLLAGGWYTAKTAEVFHPGTSTFTPTSGEMAYGRAFCAAATLTSGNVLVVGGSEVAPATYAELFSLSSGTFTTTQALNTPRSLPLVLPCNDGKAVVLGGHDPTGSNNEYDSVEIYDPNNNTFSLLQDHLFPADPGWSIVGNTWGAGVYYLKSVETQKLADGRYLLLAKKFGSSVYTLFTFDPASKAIAKFATVPDFPDAFHHPCYPIVDASRGKAYLLSTDSASGAFVNVRLYTVDLATGRRNDPMGSFPLTAGNYSQFGVTLLADGRLFMVGGVELVNSDWQSVKKTWFINPNNSPASWLNLLLMD